MVFGSYTIYDVLASLYLVILFVPLFLVPGYLAGWFTQLLNFRQLTFSWRLTIAVPLSAGTVPILIFWIGKYLPRPLLTGIFLILFLLWLALLGGFAGHERFAVWSKSLRHIPKSAVVAAVVWCGVAVLSLADLQVGNRLYFSNVSYDYAVRTAITDAITRGGVQPSNPFYGLSGQVPLRYHYFWFLPCSLAAQWSGLANASRAAMAASAVWCGWSLLGLVPIYLRFIQGVSGHLLNLRSKWGMALFAVTGLDLIPNINDILKHNTRGDLEWWNGHGQVTSWVGTLLWVPHNAAALVAGLIGFAVLWPQTSERHWQREVLAGLVSAAALASMIGDSVYVALVIAAFLSVWTVYVLLRKDYGYLLPLLTAGVVTVILAAPYLVSLAGQSGGATFVSIAARRFAPFVPFSERHWMGSIGTNLLFTALLPIQYFMELGAFSLVPFLYAPKLWRERRLPATAALTLLALVPFLIASFMKSSVVGWSNDLGWRGFLPVQFVLLLWASGVLADSWVAARNWWQVSSRGMVRLLWASLLCIGVAGTCYQLLLLRFYGPLTDAGMVSQLFIRNGDLGRITFGLRQGYDELNKMLPPGATIQSDPRWEVYDYFLGLYAHHPTAAFNTTCGVELGGVAKTCKELYPRIEGPFVHPAEYTSQDVEALSTRLHTQAFVVYRVDPAWQEAGWAGQLKPAIETGAMRVYLMPANRAAVLAKADGQ